MTIKRKLASIIPAIKRLVDERDLARKNLHELQTSIDSWRNSLRPFPGWDIPDWPLPYNPQLLLQASPQRYTENYNKYLERGGLMRPDDMRGFIHGNSGCFYDRTRFLFLTMAADMISSDRISGDIAELGVDKGNTASVLGLAAMRLGKTLYLLDTFEGFSAQDLVDMDSIHGVAFQDASLDMVRDAVNGPHVRYIKGYFPDSAQQMADNLTFCLVHLDCDLYKPFTSGLDYFWPRLVPGGFLIMHDYNSLHWDGVEKAVNTFFLNKPESIIPIPDMGGTVAVRKLK